MAYQHRPLLIRSINAGGLNIPAKRHIALRDFAKAQVSVALIQETHFLCDKAPALRSASYPLGFFGNYREGKSRGVAVLFAKHVPFQLLAHKADDEGRYVMVKGTIGEQLYTFVSIYLPNRRQHIALKKIMSVVTDFQDGNLVVGGDFNLPLDPKLDTSRGSTCVPLSVIRSTRLTLLDSTLTDCWRALHPSTRDYTHYSTLHKSYSRIDHIFLPFAQSHLIRYASIGSQTWSDHCPVDVELNSCLYRPKASHWRLNETLLSDQLVLSGLTEAVSQYFTDNSVPDVTPPLLWEAHKATARGYLIKQGARIKRERIARQEDLTAQIRILEASHKATSSEEDYVRLSALRADLNSLLNIKAQRSFTHYKHLFFEHGNRCGRLLARVLRKKRSSTYISKITDRLGGKHSLPSSMLEVFRSHFHTLYNLDKTTPPTSTLTHKIETYLQSHVKRKLSIANRQLIEAPITDEELRMAITDTPTGKAPGPDG
uniref:Endonuclease/exonuclease/phosphatase domain-containing protein n=2 Tax=Leptobrachium leishanense TaxID=445787 RepID=A0A8C5MYX6_9ANUR